MKTAGRTRAPAIPSHTRVSSLTVKRTREAGGKRTTGFLELSSGSSVLVGTPRIRELQLE